MFGVHSARKLTSATVEQHTRRGASASLYIGSVCSSSTFSSSCGAVHRFFLPSHYVSIGTVERFLMRSENVKPSRCTDTPNIYRICCACREQAVLFKAITKAVRSCHTRKHACLRYNHDMHLVRLLEDELLCNAAHLHIRKLVHRCPAPRANYQQCDAFPKVITSQGWR